MLSHFDMGFGDYRRRQPILSLTLRGFWVCVCCVTHREIMDTQNMISRMIDYHAHWGEDCCWFTLSATIKYLPIFSSTLPKCNCERIKHPTTTEPKISIARLPLHNKVDHALSLFLQWTTTQTNRIAHRDNRISDYFSQTGKFFIEHFHKTSQRT